MNKFFEHPFTLALSSGFFGFYAHVGFLKALDELQLKPAAFTGTSAGAIVASAAAKGLSVKDIEELICRVSRKDFWDPQFGVGLLRGEKLRQLIENEIGSDFENLKYPLQIPVFDIADRKTHVFKSGPLAQVIQATCAVPLMFHPVRINGRSYWDGGILDKTGIHGIDDDVKILSHFLKSHRRDPHSVYELKQNEDHVKARGNNLIQIQLDNIPKAHPFAMRRGPDIIKVVHKQALLALTSLRS